ncbi:MAG: hypothetical protein OER86_03565 [Phycisphaerae bacterium]|nr:hypothetical protein [Phycisphaerae bacterium]
MDVYQIQLGDRLVEMPWWWFDALLGWLGLMGLILWLFGRRLVRPAFVVFGLAVGAVFGLLVQRQYIPGTNPLVGVVIGALTMSGLGWMFWRIGVAGLLATVIGVAAPWLMITIQGKATPAVWPEISAGVTESKAAIISSRVIRAEANPGPEAAPTDAPTPPARLSEVLSKRWAGVTQAIRQWWQVEEGGQLFLVIVVAMFGATAAFGLGLALPSLANSLATALLGACLMAGGVGRLFDLSPSWLANIAPATPLTVSLTLLAAMIIGAAIQWMFFRRTTDS